MIINEAIFQSKLCFNVRWNKKLSKLVIEIID
jgi:hypothetical protein